MVDVLLIRADFTTENDTEIKICSPQSHVLSGYSYQSYTLFGIEQISPAFNVLSPPRQEETRNPQDLSEINPRHALVISAG